MKEPLVTIIMPAYNCEKYISFAIEAIIDQTYSNWELLITNDASTDRTEKEILRYANIDNRISAYSNESNQGYLYTWNNLVKRANGEFITFLDADDTCTSDRIQKLSHHLVVNPELGIVGSNIGLMTEDGEVYGFKKYPVSNEAIKSQLLNEAFPFCGSAVMIRREVITIVGGYNSFFERLGWEDHDWLIRVCSKFHASNIAEPLYYYRDNPLSVTRAFTPQQLPKFFIKKIGIDIHKIYENEGRYLLDGNHFWEVFSIVNKYTEPLVKYPNLLFRYLMVREKNKKNRLYYLVKALAHNPLDVKTIYLFFRTW